jgi:hypothetical protein
VIRAIAVAILLPTLALADSLPSQTTTTTVGTHRALDVNVVAAPSTAVTGAVTANQGTPAAAASAWMFRLTDTSLNLSLLNSAPGSDTGQVAVPVRIISSLSVPVTVSGTVPVSGPLTDTQLRASAVPVTANQGGTWVVQPGNTANTTAWKVDGSSVTQPVSGSVSVSNFPATQPVSGTVAVSGTIPVSGPLTDTQLRASAVPVSGTFFQSTQPVSATQLPSALGAKTTANSMAVNIASDQTVPVSGTFFQVTQPVSAAALPLPSNAAQETGGNLATIATNTTGEAKDATLTGGSAKFQMLGQDYSGTQRVPQVDPNGVVYVYIARPAPPLNPLLPRCNAVRRTNCQP